jgi:CheY-like chemotaxis protein
MKAQVLSLTCRFQTRRNDQGKILLIDDEPEIIAEFERALKSEGYTVDTALSTGFAADLRHNRDALSEVFGDKTASVCKE